MNYFNHGWMMGLGWLIPLLTIAIIFYLVLENKKERLSAQDILDKRYANGEIDKEEYEEKSNTLKKNN